MILNIHNPEGAVLKKAAKQHAHLFDDASFITDEKSRFYRKEKGVIVRLSGRESRIVEAKFKEASSAVARP
jgi:hypothetical protein